MTTKNGLPCKKCGTGQWDNRGRCLFCKRRIDREWYSRNKDKKKATVRRWQSEHYDFVKEYARNWNRENPERHRASHRRWQIRHADYERERKRRWSRGRRRRYNRELASRCAKRWYLANLEKARAKARIYGHIRRTRISGAGGSYTRTEFLALCRKYGNRCVNPRCPNQHLDEVKLTADHVVPVVMGGSSYISNIQPLCGTCNSRKGVRIIDYRNKPIARLWVQPPLLSFGD